MDKQKQIEEMARIIAFDLCPNRHVHAKWGEEAQCYSDNNFAECTKIKNVVDKLYNAYYRKIPENAVLTREEYETYTFIKHKWGNQDAIKWSELVNGLYEFARAFSKKTADKFSKMLKENYPLKEGFSHLHFVIDEICKEITEGKE